MPRGSWLIERTPVCWRSAFEAGFMFARSAETSKGAANIAHSPIWTLSSSRLKPKSPMTSCQPVNISIHRIHFKINVLEAGTEISGSLRNPTSSGSLKFPGPATDAKSPSLSPYQPAILRILWKLS